MQTVQYWQGSAENKNSNQRIKSYQNYAINVFKLKGVPDFASGRFKRMEHLDPSARVSFVANLQKNLLKSLAYFSNTQYDNSNGNVSCGYSLRVIYNPLSHDDRASTNIYLIGRVADNYNEPNKTQEIKQKQFKYIQSTLRSLLYQFDSDIDYSLDSQEINPDTQDHCYEVVKSEEVFTWLEEEKKYFYSPGEFQVNKSNDLIALFEQLEAYNEKVCIDVTLVPTSIDDKEKKSISRFIDVLSQISRGSNDDELDPDSNAQKAKSVYENIKKQYYSGIIFLYSIRVFSACQDTCQNIANQLATCGTANTTSPKIVLVQDNQYAVETAKQINVNEEVCVQKIWNYNQIVLDGFSGGPQIIKRLHRLISLDEASAFFRLPIPINQPCPGVPYDTGTSRHSSKKQQSQSQETKKTKTIELGKFYRNQPTDEVCDFNIEKLKTHMLIVGGSGSGKTTTTFNILWQLWSKHKIPFIVFDPKVTPEYRYLKRLKEFQNDLLIFTPGQEFIAPFRMNPFEVIDGIPLQEHISRIFDCFIGALPVEDPLPSFIMKAIDKNYEDKGWQIAQSRGGSQKDGKSFEFPTMEDLRNQALYFAKKNYGRDKEVGDRIKGALDARLYRLTSNSGVAEMFRATKNLPLKDLMEKPVIFELGGLNKEEQSLFSLFILTFIFEHIRAERIGNFKAGREGESVTDLDLRHVILVEEAHNLLGSESTSGEKSSSKFEVIDKFAQIMREMRSAGEGVIVVDQSPAALAQPIVDATNLKLMHRLPSPDDREYLGRAMCLSEGETQLSGIFSAGQGFYYVPGWDRAQRVDTTNFKEDNPEVKEALKAPVSDDKVQKLMEKKVEELFPRQKVSTQPVKQSANQQQPSNSQDISIKNEQEALIQLRKLGEAQELYKEKREKLKRILEQANSSQITRDDTKEKFEKVVVEIKKIELKLSKITEEINLITDKYIAAI